MNDPRAAYLPVDIIFRPYPHGLWATVLFPDTKQYMHFTELELRELHRQLTAALQEFDAKAGAK